MFLFEASARSLEQNWVDNGADLETIQPTIFGDWTAVLDTGDTRTNNQPVKKFGTITWLDY